MKFSSIFGGLAQQPTAPAQAAPAQPAAVVPPAAAAQQVQLPVGVAAVPATPAATAGAPAIDWAGVMKAAAEANSAAAPQVVPPLDMAKLQAAIQGRNFVTVTPENAAALAAGGDQAAQVFIAMANQAAQTAFVEALRASRTLTEMTVGNQTAAVDTRINKQVRDVLAQQHLQGINPALASPQFQPMLEMIKSGLAASQPQLTPEQLASEANRYLTDMVSQLAPQKTQGGQNTASDGIDYFAHFGLNSQ